MTDAPERPVDFDERWTMFVSWMNSVREQWAVNGDGDDGYKSEVEGHFFALINHPATVKQKLTITHAVRVLEQNNVSAKDAGFIMFVLFVSGAVWGNRGVLPKTRDEDVGLGAGNAAVNREDLQ